ncbi:MAG: ligase-associated DNA damage response DEXH box helicase [Planctomycetaceae bacterium]
MMNAKQRAAFKTIQTWFHQHDRKPFAFQKQAWRAFLEGKHGLIHAPTGTGKTLAAFLGSVIQWLAEGNVVAAAPATGRKRRTEPQRTLQVLWITPLRALSQDTATHLQTVLEDLKIPWLVETRTGDTRSSERNRQRKRFPEVLITTPESLTAFLSHAETKERFAQLRLIVVDEWHELLGSKRGVQTELALARVRTWQPRARVWGLSATIGNLSVALEALVGPAASPDAELIDADRSKRLIIETLIPKNIERFPWAGHLGTRLAEPVAKIVLGAKSSLVFTNTRSQTEFWYRALLQVAPELAGQLAVHHGSIDQSLRRWIEDQLRSGKLRCCVATSSLDLGVDFTTVDHVIQIGSPKGIARLSQRGGRSGHQPGVASRITLVPTNALELLEFAALRDAVKANQMESRRPRGKPLDVLAQHLVTVALAGGFVESELLREVRSTAAYSDLTDEEWKWTIDFVVRGGDSLLAYEDFHRLEAIDGRYQVTNPKIARLHRLSIGTIVSDSAIAVKFTKGRSIGSVEESFISRIEPGDNFLFAGKLLELIRVHDNVAWVRRGKGASNTIPRWLGGRMPLSSELSRQIRIKLEEASQGRFKSPEMRSLRPLLELQQAWSALPHEGQLLIEQVRNRFGYHLFVYPFEGRLVHEGLATLLALRMSRIEPNTFSMAMNDYGFVLVSPKPAPLEAAIAKGLFEPQRLSEDILAGLNATEMCRRQFREIARIAGLVFQGYPGQPKSGRHLQASSNLFHDVFVQYDPENMLLLQSRREVLQLQLEEERMHEALLRMREAEWVIRELRRPGPLAFPLVVDGLRDRVSSETLADRVRRMTEELEQLADQMTLSRTSK